MDPRLSVGQSESHTKQSFLFYLRESKLNNLRFSLKKKQNKTIPDSKTNFPEEYIRCVFAYVISCVYLILQV